MPGLPEAALASALALAEVDGVRPRSFMRGRGLATRVRTPRAAMRGIAPVNGTPGRAWRASTPGESRQALTRSWRACARGWSCSVGAVTGAVYPLEVLARSHGRSLQWVPSTWGVLVWTVEGQLIAHVGIVTRDGTLDGAPVQPLELPN
jgi:hypothetical protein